MKGNIRTPLPPNSTTGKDAYQFFSTDPKDGRTYLDKIGCCDDNTKFFSVEIEEDLLMLTNHFIEQAGDLSLVTKIGHKGSKRETHYFNFTSKTASTFTNIKA